MTGVVSILRATIVALVVAALGAAPAGAAGLETILQDDAQLLHRPDDQLKRSLEELKLLGIDRIRVTAGWSVLTRDADSEAKPNFDATDPRAYEHERWRNLDRLLVLARAKGFATMVDVAFWAPRWASADPAGARGRTSIDAQEYAKFAVAVARRYSGEFKLDRAVLSSSSGSGSGSRDASYLEQQYGSTNRNGEQSLHGAFGLPLPAGLLGDRDPEQEEVDAALGTATSPPTAPLPEVDVLTLWNEPNHSGFMRPQWQRRHGRWLPRSPHVYRDLVIAAYPAVKAVRPEATVLIGATAAYGSYSNRGVGNVAPLRFIRELACVDRRLEHMRRSGCDRFRPVPGDGWSHHPYTMQTEPDAPPRRGARDDVPLSRLGDMARLIDRLVRRGRLAPGVRNLWVTEYGYETNPPVKGHHFTPGDQARFLPWAEYLAQSVPSVRSFAQFLLRDLPPGAFKVGKSKRRAFGQWQSGLLFEDGTPKLGAHAFRTGLFVKQRRGDRKLTLFGRLRLGSGPRVVRIERRPPGTDQWRTVLTKAPGADLAESRFVIDGRDAFLRFGYGTGRHWRYRALYLEGSEWRGQSAPSVAPVLRR